MRDSDVLSRFVFEHAPVRGEIVHLDASFRAILERRHYPEPVRTLLGEFMAAATLLAATLKFEGRLILQIQGGGPLTLLVVECTSDHTLRAVAHWEGDVGPSLEQAVGDGRLVITVEPRKGEERYQGIVNLEGATVSEAMERYYAQSEQVETRVWLACDDTRAAGLLLQRLPGTSEDADFWPRAIELTSTLSHSELLALPPAEVLRRLYHEEDIRLFSPAVLSFRCSCSRERVEAVLQMLGREDINNLLAEQGSVSVDCEFCGKHYAFDAVDVEQVFVASPISSAPAQKH